MTLFSARSFLVVRPASIVNHRSPAPLAGDALQLWLKGLGVFQTELAWDEIDKGFRLLWALPHQPVIEAVQIDTVRVNFAALAALFQVKFLPEPTPDTGTLEGDTPCYHAWNITKDLKQEDEEEDKQSGLFEEVPELDGLPICFGDTETTGFSPTEDRIIQLALVRISPIGEVRRYTSYFNSEGRKNNGFTVNKIPDWKIRNAPFLRNLIPIWMPLLTGAVFVAHNAGFDQRMLTGELKRYGCKWPDITVIDTQKLAKIIWPKAPKHKLEVLAEWLGLKQGRAHDAMGDTETLMALWEAMRAERPNFTLSMWARMAA